MRLAKKSGSGAAHLLPYLLLCCLKQGNDRVPHDHRFDPRSSGDWAAPGITESNRSKDSACWWQPFRDAPSPTILAHRSITSWLEKGPDNRTHSSASAAGDLVSGPISLLALDEHSERTCL